MTTREDVLTGGEGDALRAFLHAHMEYLLHKLEGVSDEDLRRAMVPSGTSLLGLVKHETYMLHRWLHMRFAGEPSALAAEPEWVIRDDETTSDIVSRYRDEVERAQRLIGDVDPDAPSKGLGPRGDGKPGDFKLRWILLHAIEEMAQHNGHADILRELIDGSIG